MFRRKNKSDRSDVEEGKPLNTSCRFSQQESQVGYDLVVFKKEENKKVKFIKYPTLNEDYKRFEEVLLANWNKTASQSFLISIVGGVRDCPLLNGQIRSILSKNIASVAKNGNIWFIVDSIDEDLASLVVDLVEDIEENSVIIPICIAPWNNVDITDLDFETTYEKPVNENNAKCTLNSNYSLFVFCDNSNLNETRREFETLIRSAEICPRLIHVPLVLIVINGALETLITIHERLHRDIPIVLIQGTKGAADLIIEGRNAIQGMDVEQWEIILDQILERDDYKSIADTDENKQTAKNLLMNILKNENFNNLLSILHENEENTIIDVFLKDTYILKPNEGNILEMNFSYYNKKAKYVKVANKNDDAFMGKLCDLIFNQNGAFGFGLPKPNLLLSVIGGTKYFPMDKDTKAAFKLGLMRAAKDTNAWIISNGLDEGVSRIVGDALEEDFEACDLTVLGIAPLGYVFHKENENKRKVALNAQYNYFIFVDDQKSNQIGVEAEFRHRLENYIKSNESISMVIVVLEGGFDTLKIVYDALKKKTPIILVAGTSGCADLVIDAKYSTKNIKQKLWPEIFDKMLEKDSYKSFLNVKDKNERRTQIKDLLQNILSNRFFNICIDIFEISVKAKMESKILDALVNTEGNVYHRIKLAIIWNLYDTAKKELMGIRIGSDLTSKKRLNTDATEHETNRTQIIRTLRLHELFELVLLENRPQFVELLLKIGYLTEWYLTKERLLSLYNNKKDRTTKKTEELIRLYYPNKDIFSYNDIEKFLKNCFNTFNPFFLPQNETISLKFHCELNLFFWCLLTNRIEIAKIFWRISCNQICFALMAVKILNIFARSLPEHRKILEERAIEFEDLAIGILDVFDKNTRQVVNDVLVIRYLDYIKMDSLELAVDCKCKRFLSHPVVQNTLDRIWKGSYDDQSAKIIKTTSENKLITCQRIYNDNVKYIFNNNNLRHFDENQNCFNRLINILYRPSFKFILNAIFYAIFLLVFTVHMLFEEDFSLNEIKTENDNQTNGTIVEKKFLLRLLDKFEDRYPIIEGIILLWVSAFLLEEIRQAFFSVLSKGSLTIRIRNYCQKGWNKFDMVGCVLFFGGLCLRFISFLGDPDAKTWSRIILSVDLNIWFIRSLQYCLVSKSLGPKLLMIRKMVEDLKYFLIIIATFILAFGVSIQAIMSPHSQFNYMIVFDIFEKAYWPMYGEMRPLEILREESCSKVEPGKPCINASKFAVSQVLLMLYMIIASVLILNLLIAVFSSTYESIQTKSDIIWQNQRYELVSEYMELPIIPPPLNLFLYPWFVLKYLRNKNRPSIKKTNQEDIQSMNSVIDAHETDAIIEFERKCAEELIRNINLMSQSDIDEKLDRLEKQLYEQNLLLKSFQKMLEEKEKS